MFSGSSRGQATDVVLGEGGSDRDTVKGVGGGNLTSLELSACEVLSLLALLVYKSTNTDT